MEFKKGFLIICLIICLFSIASVAAGDVNETVMVGSDAGDIIEQTNDKEVISSQDDIGDTLAIEEDAMGIDENTIISKQADDEATLTKQIEDKEVLSDYDNLKTLKITFIKQTGKYDADKKVYFKVTDVDTGRRVANAEIYYEVYRSTGAGVTCSYATTKSNGIGVITFSGDIEHSGTFTIKADLYDWDASKYGKSIYTKQAIKKNVKIYVKKTSKQKTTPRIIASKKTYKANVKVKKYAITLKNNKNKPVKHAKVTLKVKGKTYWAKTNGKGKAKFKIRNLNSRGNFIAKIKFAGNKHYKAATKKVRIKVKAPKIKKPAVLTFKGKSKYSWKIKASTWKKMKRNALYHYRWLRSRGSISPGFSYSVNVIVTRGSYHHAGIAMAVKNDRGMRCEVRHVPNVFRISTWGDIDY